MHDNSGRKADLTICSVFHNDMTRQILELNEEFVRKMNPGMNWVRFAANNSRKEIIRLKDPNILEFPPGIIPEGIPNFTLVGYDAGSAMNGMLPHIKTRFVLFLDYDFFIIRPGWIKDVLNYMDERKLAILGVPYHPKYYGKVRYFPSQHCLFVDKNLVGKEFYEWDFMPQYSAEELKKTVTAAKYKSEHKVLEIKKKANYFRRFLRDNIQKRRYLAFSKDIPYDLYRRYFKQNKIKYECFLPAAVIGDFVRNYYIKNAKWHPFLYLLEKMIPEKWSYVPKKKGYFTFSKFKDAGKFDVMGEGMEEFFWKDAPFGFHMRGFKERQYKALGKVFDAEENIKNIREITANFNNSK